MRRVEKGNFGYTNAHKRAQLLKTFIYFLLPAAIFTVGYITTKGKQNYFTIIALVGALPACKELVNVIMFWKRRSIPEELYREIEEHAGKLCRAYELVLTTYDKNYPVHSLVVRGNEAAGYATLPASDLKSAQEYVASVLKQNGLGSVHVHFFPDLKQYLDRVDVLASKEDEKEKQAFTPDERYPDLTKEEFIRELILSISL